MLADPAETRVTRERLLEHRRAVDERAEPARARALLDRAGEPGEPRAQHLVIVAAERVARDVAAPWVREHAARLARALRPVVHARRDHAHGAVDELGGAGALAAVPAHVFHGAVAPCGEPFVEPALVGGEVDAADADFREAERAAERLHFGRESRESLLVVRRHVVEQGGVVRQYNRAMRSTRRTAGDRDL